MPITYQEYYKSKVGSCLIDIKKAVAGSTLDLKLTYKVGSLGVDDSGSMKVLMRIVSDCGDPQFDAPDLPNYVSFNSNKPNLKITPTQKSNGVFAKVHERPWSKGFVLVFSGDSLGKGDRVEINFINWQIQTFAEEKFKFKILVDPFASARFIELPNSPFFEITAGIPNELQLIVPSTAELGSNFEAVAVLKDTWGNSCLEYSGEVNFISKNLALSKSVKLKRGFAKAKVKANSEGANCISGLHKNLESTSNVIVVSQSIKNMYFWGDLHGQSEETVGTGDIDSYFNFARDIACLDFAGHQGNDFQVTNDFWRKINQTTKKFTKNGKFIAIPGYEWSGNTPVGGDRNVIYLEEGQTIFRSSHALLDDFSDVRSDIENVDSLFAKLRKRNALVLAHVGGRYSNLEMYDEKLCPTVEVHSDWGTFEWFLFDALKKNHKVGVVANSDCHDGRPGASFPGLGHFYSYGGLTCIIAKNLNRKNIFDALKARHVYATTGDRIFLNLEAYRSEKSVGMMGDVIDKPTHLSVKVFGNSPIDRLEVYDKDKLIDNYYPQIPSENKKAVKVVWGGSSAKGRKRSFPWKGNLVIKDNNIKSLETFNLFNKHLLKNLGNTIAWESTTTGGLQGAVLYLESTKGLLEFDINGKKELIDVSTINQKPFRYGFGGLDAKLEVYQVDTSNIPGNVEHVFELSNLKEGSHAVFVKVIQKNGHIAWSSPVFFNS